MHITLSGYYGFDNTGDEALLAAITQSIRRHAPLACFTVLSGSPGKTSATHDIESVYYLSPFAVLKTIRNTDLLISGGGSIFQDVTSWRSLAYYISVVALARFFDRPVIFYAQGVGPIRRGISKFLMRLVGNHATQITLRDRDSMEYLHGIGVTQPPMQVTADPVFSLTPTDEDREKAVQILQEINPDGAPIVGVALRPWAALDGYQPTLAAALDKLAAAGYTVVFIPMAHGEDESAGAAVASCMKEKSCHLQESLSAAQHMAIIGRMRLGIGMRLHALVFAAKEGIPLAGISYDPKVESFLSILDEHAMPLNEQMHAHIEAVLARPLDDFEKKAQSFGELADENARLALSLLDEQAPPPPKQSAEQTQTLMSAETTRTTGINFIWVSIAMFFAKALGFGREIIFAARLGTGVMADAFQTIFGLPMLLFTAVGNSIATVNMPELTARMQGDQAKRRAYIANISMHITLVFGLISLLGIVAAPLLTGLLVPGLEGQALEIATTLTMLMMPTLFLVNIAYFAAGVLQAHGFFLMSSIISVPFNLLVILALIFGGGDIVFIGAATTVGWFLQFAIQYPHMKRLGYSFVGRKIFSGLGRGPWRSLLPILLGYSVLQICLIIDRRFGTLLPEGTSAALAFGSNLSFIITSVFVMAISIIVFPRLSKFCLERDFAGVRRLLGTAAHILAATLLPYMLLVAFFHTEIVTIVYQRGAFDYESTRHTATAFLFYSFVAIGYACQEVFNRVFYALKKYRVPAVAAAIGIVLNIGLNLAVYARFGIMGISLSTAAVMTVYAVVLFVFLRREIGGGLGLHLLYALVRVALPLAAMLAVMLVGRAFSYTLPAAVATIIAAGIVYLVALYLAGYGKIIKR
jgi:putative peptidoglycan lipid II flippase